MSAKVEIDAAWFRAVREKAGLSVEQAAELCGLAPYIITGIEKGYRTLTQHQAEQLARALERIAKRPTNLEAAHG
jgi:transcriptional regulator with XRE-family HTH domain